VIKCDFFNSEGEGSAHDLGGGGASLPHFLDVSAKIFHYVSGKFFSAVRRLSNLKDRAEYSFILKIFFGIWQTM
jgi:hypothetical protein